MAKKLSIKSTAGLQKIKRLSRQSKTADTRLRWQIIYTLIVDYRSTALIAKQFGCSEWLVRDSVKEYKRKGLAAFNGLGSGYNRSNFHLDLSKEEEILSEFTKQSKKGLITTYHRIKERFEKEIGKKLDKSVIYRLLKRHKWRKISPSQEHPKADKHAQAEFKKNSPIWFPSS